MSVKDKKNECVECKHPIDSHSTVTGYCAFCKHKDETLIKKVEDAGTGISGSAE